MKAMEDYSMKLKEWREAKGWSQHELADYLTKSIGKGKTIYQSHVQNWENGKMPRYPTMLKIKDATDGRVSISSWL